MYRSKSVEGEIVCIVGESGSGKTVSLLSILGLTDRRNTKIEGSVIFRGRRLLDLPEREMRQIRGREIGFISQNPMTALTPVHTIGWQIEEQIRVHLNMSRAAARRRAAELLDEVGLPNPTKALGLYPHQLSGGMRQRAVIAMALSCNPSLLVADEPTTALDVTVQAQVLELLRRLRLDFGLSIILVTHDMGVVGEMADRVHGHVRWPCRRTSADGRHFRGSLASLHVGPPCLDSAAAWRTPRAACLHSGHAAGAYRLAERLRFRVALPFSLRAMRRNPASTGRRRAHSALLHRSQQSPSPARADP